MRINLFKNLTGLSSLFAALAVSLSVNAQVCFNPSSTSPFAVLNGPVSITSADFNADGKTDLATANNGTNTVSVLLGFGGGSFGAAVNFVVGANPISVISADFNADGKVDLALANNGSSNVSVLLGNGAGGFGNAVNFAVGLNPNSLTSADFNADGKLDLAVANNGNNNVSVLLGNGLGGFAAAVNFTVGASPESLTNADFNGDGKADLAVANNGSANISILLGNGAGNFGPAVNFAVGTNPISVISADFNVDGKMDLATANLTSNNVSVLLGNGLGSFATAVSFSVGTGPWSVITADFNGDTRADLALANGNSNNVSVLLGNGLGSFAPAVNFAAGNGPRSLINADFNTDGKSDLAVANGSSNNVSVLLNGTPSVTANATSTFVCAGTSITLTGGGASTYTWSGAVSDGVAFIPPTGTTTYTVTGKDAVGCTNTQTITVTVNPLPVITVNSPTICNGQTATLTASTVSAGGTSYMWNTNNTTAVITVSPPSTTVYTVTGTSAGCSSSQTGTVTVNLQPTITVNSATICAGQSATLAASGATTYTWSIGSNASSITVSPTSTSIYSVIGINNFGCSNTQTASVTVNSNPTTAINAGFTNPTCNGLSNGSATITASGASPFTYSWSPSGVTTSTINGLSAGSYTCEVKNMCGTTSSKVIVINQPPPLNVSVSVAGAPACIGNTVSLTASIFGGTPTYSINWSTGSTSSSINVFPSIIPSTNYSVYVSDSQGCITSKTIPITVNPRPSITVSPSNPTICVGKTATINLSGAQNYTTNPGGITLSSFTVNPTSTTIYSITGTNTQGCSNYAHDTVSVVSSPTILSNVNTNTLCVGSILTFSNSGGSTYTLTPSALTGSVISIFPSTAGTTIYTVYGTNAMGCTNSKSISITTYSLPNVSISPSNTTICSGQSIVLSGAGANSYTWAGSGSTANFITVSPTVTTTYSVRGKNSNGCERIASSVVNVSARTSVIPVSTPSAVCIGDTAVLSVIGGYVPMWSTNPIPNTSIVTPTINTSYTIQAVDFNGCVSDIVFNVGINIDCGVIVYNGFTPNGDGINDFLIIDNIDKYPNNKVYIYNRWGNKIFQTSQYNNSNNNWDGKLNGKSVTAGTYFYIILDQNDKLFKKGWIEITN